MLIDDSEREDFKRAVEAQGLKIEDFELIEQEDPHDGPGIYSITGTVTVLYRPTGKRGKYRAGDQSCWVAEADRDLKAGLFA
jgi:hypothetical protein